MKGRAVLFVASFAYFLADEAMRPHSLPSALLSGALLGVLIGAAEMGVFKDG